MIEMKTSIISPNVSLRANPIHADQMLGSHGDGDCQCQTEHTAGNRAITKSIFSVVREDDSVFAHETQTYDGKDALN